MSDGLTAERLREVLNYDAETGLFTWRFSTSKRVRVGAVAGNKSVNGGYVDIRIDGRLYKAHRLAWLYVTGGWPEGDIDHINGIPGDDRFANLREATHAANMQNSKRRKHNTSGFKGVRHTTKTKKRWQSIIRKDGRTIYLGTFPTPEEAHAAYCKAAEELHGEFARFA